MTRAVDDDLNKKPEEEEEETTASGSGPPDGGWGWLIVVASLVCNIVVDGVCFSFSIFREEFKAHFNCTNAQVGWVGSLLTGSYLTVGPVVSALATKYGCRKVTICGSILASVAFLISTQSSSIYMMIITYGVLGGVGFGLIYLPAIVTVGYWFEKKRAFATGIAVCGSGIGTFIFAPLGRYLVDEYSWQGSNVLIAGIILNCAVCGALFRPLQKKSKRTKREEVIQRGSIMKALIEEKKRQRTISNGSLDNCIITKDNRLIKIDPSLFDCKTRNNSVIARFKESLGFSTKSLNRSKQSLVIPSIVIDSVGNSGGSVSPLVSPIYKKPSAKNPKPFVSLSSENGGCAASEQVQKAQSCDIIPQNDPWLRLSQDGSLNSRSLSCNGVNGSLLPASGLGASVISIQVVPNGSSASLRNRMLRSNRSVLYTSRGHSTPATIVGASVMSIPQYSTSLQSLDLEGRSTFVKAVYLLRNMFDFHLLKSPMFALLVFASILSMLGFFIPFFYLGLKAQELNIGPDYWAFLLSIIGITNTIGRVISGWIADRPWADSLHLNNFALIISGVLTLLCPLCQSYTQLALYSAAFGLCIAVFVSLRSILLVDLLGLEMLTESFGILILFQGLASMAGAPLAGELLDTTGTVDGCFYLAGSLIALSGLLGFPLRRLKNWELGKRPPPLPEEMPIAETLRIDQVETTM